MQFVYSPEGAEPMRWAWEPSKLMSPECIAIEKLTKLTFGEWEQAVRKGSIEAAHALLYVLLKRSNPTLRPSEVQFTPAEIDFVVSDDEARRVLAKLKALPAEDLDEGDRVVMASLVAQVGDVDEDLDDAAEEPDDAGEAEPPADAEDGAVSGSPKA